VDLHRLEAFSDGVLAVAITLLALDLAVSGPGHGTLLSQLEGRWPQFAAYIVSFVTIGVIWVNHHALFRAIARVGRPVLFLNLLLLMSVVAIPFATSTVATYLRAGGTDSHVAAALYGVVMECMSIGFVAIFLASHRAGHLVVPLGREDARRAVVRFGLGIGAYAVAIAVALVNAPAALVLNGLVALYYVSRRTPGDGEPSPEA